MNEHQLLTRNVQITLGELLFDKIQLMTEQQVHRAQIADLQKKVEDLTPAPVQDEETPANEAE